MHKYLTVDDREGIETKAGIELWERENNDYNNSEKIINHSTHSVFCFFLRVRRLKIERTTHNEKKRQ